jgi:hypothetical protein
MSGTASAAPPHRTPQPILLSDGGAKTARNDAVERLTLLDAPRANPRRRVAPQSRAVARTAQAALRGPQPPAA